MIIEDFSWLRERNSENLVLDCSHEEHTMAIDGSFVHPFNQVDTNVDSIYYKKSKTISSRVY